MTVTVPSSLSPVCCATGGPDKLLLNLRDNLYAPLLLARLCEQAGIHFTYFGTGCIFKYDEQHQPYGVAKTEEVVPCCS